MTDYKLLKSRFDHSDMLDMIAGFSGQIMDSIRYMNDWTPSQEYPKIENILIIGMGGSAIGGDFVSAYLEKDCKVPIIVNRSYKIPGWVNNGTLVIASSYSGNTEETLSAFRQSIEKNAQTICVTTGGELMDFAKKENLDIVNVPKGLQPRAALGFSFSLNFLLLAKIGFVNFDSKKSELTTAVDKIKNWQEDFGNLDTENTAMEIAQKIQNTFPVIYAGAGWPSVCALRFRGQLAENSKILASHFLFPEQNHNEIEGWTCYPEIIGKTSIIWLKDEGDHAQVQKRMQITKDLLEDYPADHIEIKLEGESRLERMLKMIHLLDWVSYFTALLNEIDPTPVDRITQLKSKLVDK